MLLALTEADASAAGPARLDRLARHPARPARRRRARPARRPGRQPRRRSASTSTPGRRPSTATLVAAVRAGEPQVRVIATGGSHRLDITDLDRVGLFADTAGLLAAEGHTVRTAILRTVDGIAVNEWHVESPSGAVPDPSASSAAWPGSAAATAARSRRSTGGGPTWRGRRGRASLGAPGQARALVVPGASSDATVLEVRAQDRPGLLHELGAALAGAGISVRSAHIATYAGQTLDTFYLTGADGLPLPPARVAQAVSLVIDTCDGV